GGASRAEDIEGLAEEADAVIVFRTPVTAAAIARMRQCRILLRQGIGFDLIDVAAATRAGIFVSNVPDYCIDEVASHAMALLLGLLRNLSAYVRIMREKGWGFYHHGGRKLRPLSEMKLGVIGLGKIGRRFAQMARPFGFRIAAYDPYLHQDIFDQADVERV